MLCLMAMLAGCCTTSGAGVAEPHVIYRTRVVDSGCDWTAPIYVEQADVLTDRTARSILAHNRAGAKNCGWRSRP